MSNSQQSPTRLLALSMAVSVANEAFFNLVERAPFGVYVVDETLRIAMINEEAQRRAFRNVNPALGHDLNEAMLVLWGEDVAAAVMKEFRHTLASGESFYSKSFIHARADIERVEAYEWELHRIKLPDGQFGVVCYYFDSTKLQQAQDALVQQKRRYEAILTNTPDFAYIWDLNHRFIYVNEGLLKIWGKTWEQAIGRNCLELGYEPWHAEMHDRDIERVVATKKMMRSEVPFTGAYGGRRIYDYILTPVFDNHGNVVAVAGLTRDVTDYKQAQESLRQSDRRKDEFIATLAHELRNPLAPIANSVALLNQIESSDPILNQARGTIQRQITQLTRLVDDLLDISRISSDKVELRKERVELATVLNGAIETCTPLLNSFKHELTVTLPPKPVWLDADPVRLGQVFGNLLNNACKYTPQGGTVSISAEASGRDVRVTVKDNGVGIPPDKIANIFDIFSQVGRSLERQHGGLGIGLHLVKRLVEMHGGSVEVRSGGEGKGSAFVVYLSSTALPAGEIVEPAASRTESPRRRVLVVDDNVDSAETLVTLLQLSGHETEMAHDGLEAVAKTASYKPEVILLDIGLPKLNGYETCMRIRTENAAPGVFITALTGWGQAEDRLKSKEAGFDEHLTKPVEPEHLMELLAKLPQK